MVKKRALNGVLVRPGLDVNAAPQEAVRGAQDVLALIRGMGEMMPPRLPAGSKRIDAARKHASKPFGILAIAPAGLRLRWSACCRATRV